MSAGSPLANPTGSVLDAITRDRLLRRIGLTGVPSPDAGGLRTVHRAFLSHVPYEDLAVQLGECGALEPRSLVNRVLQGGRGGYCFEANTVLHALLETLGFPVQRREGIVGARGSYANGEPTNHMALVVDTPDGGPFIADAGLGEGSLDPLPLAVGTVSSGAFEFTVERDGDGWWVGQHKFGSVPGFRFADAPAMLAEFAPHHARLSTSPDSSFVQTLVVQRPFEDRIVTLRARTLFVDGPGRRERQVLPDAGAFAAALREQFGIDPVALGRSRLDLLWAKAAGQHRAHDVQDSP